MRIQSAIREANDFFTSDDGVRAVRAAETPSDLADAVGETSYDELATAISLLEDDMRTAVFFHLKAAVQIGAPAHFVWNDRPDEPQAIATSYTKESPMRIEVHAWGTGPDAVT